MLQLLSLLMPTLLFAAVAICDGRNHPKYKYHKHGDISSKQGPGVEFDWVVRQNVYSPDGYPRMAISVVDKKMEVESAPLNTAYLKKQEPSPYNTRLTYKGNGRHNSLSLS